MKYILLYLFMAAMIASCAQEQADLRSRSYSKDADAVGEYDGSIHWDTSKMPKDTKKDEPNKDGTKDENEEGPSPDAAIRDLQPSVGVRNLDQIRYSMASVTGISMQNANVRAIYAELRTQLPTNNDIREITPAKLSAVTKLGAQFCDEAMLSPQARASLLPGINFATPPSQALANPSAAAQMLIDRFWGMNLENRADPAADVDTVATLINELKAEQPNTTQATASILMGACTAVISSAPFIVF